MGRGFTNLHMRTAAAKDSGTFCGGSHSPIWNIELRSVAPGDIDKLKADPHPCRRCIRAYEARVRKLAELTSVSGKATGKSKTAKVPKAAKAAKVAKPKAKAGVKAAVKVKSKSKVKVAPKAQAKSKTKPVSKKVSAVRKSAPKSGNGKSVKSVSRTAKPKPAVALIEVPENAPNLETPDTATETAQ